MSNHATPAVTTPAPCAIAAEFESAACAVWDEGTEATRVAAVARWRTHVEHCVTAACTELARAAVATAVTVTPALDRVTWVESTKLGTRAYVATPVPGYGARWAVTVTEQLEGAPAQVDDFGGAWWTTHNVEDVSGLKLCKGDCCRNR